jgi:predicted DCC family thiol-disulfide oxidoreductase YuxK
MFKLASVQSPEGQALLDWFGLRTDEFDTMVLVEGARVFTRSDSFVRVVARLPFPYRLAALAWCVPRPVRDWLYDRVALNRYRLFGRHEACILPTPDHASRFLG